VKVDVRPDAKNVRVVGFAGIVKRGRAKFFMGLPGFDRLVEQACEFPKGRHGHDDYIDDVALLYQQLTKAVLTLPVVPAPRNPILALIADRENALVKQLTADELQQLSHPDMTGLD